MEKRIIEAKFTGNKLARTILIVSSCLILVGLLIATNTYLTGYGRFNYSGWYINTYNSFMEFLMVCIIYIGQMGAIETVITIMIDLGIIGILMGAFFIWKMSRCSLTVTNRRVTGKASFGKIVELPLNQISAVGLGAFGRISIATSSGQIHFWFVKNIDEVHFALTDILGKVMVGDVHAKNSTGSADELKKYKELLDSGVITQEEFDAKKKQLLGL